MSKEKGNRSVFIGGGDEEGTIREESGATYPSAWAAMDAAMHDDETTDYVAVFFNKPVPEEDGCGIRASQAITSADQFTPSDMVAFAESAGSVYAEKSGFIEAISELQSKGKKVPDWFMQVFAEIAIEFIETVTTTMAKVVGSCGNDTESQKTLRDQFYNALGKANKSPLPHRAMKKLQICEVTNDDKLFEEVKKDFETAVGHEIPKEFWHKEDHAHVHDDDDDEEETIVKESKIKGKKSYGEVWEDIINDKEE